MTEYMVYLETPASATITVDVPDDTPEEEIIETAYDMAIDAAQCSGWGQKFALELGEWDVAKDLKGRLIAPEKV